jgi:magnesium chelatase family protein
VDGYQRRLSGPLLDRIDLKVSVRRVSTGLLASEPQGEASAPVRERVIAARRRQLDRQGCLNAMLKPARLRRQAWLDPASRRALERWADQQGLSARGFHRAWRVARTAADLDGSDQIGEPHVLEALGYRLQDAAAGRRPKGRGRPSSGPAGRRHTARRSPSSWRPTWPRPA